MASMTSPDLRLLTQELSAACLRLRSRLDALSACSGVPDARALSPQNITNLLAELRQTGEWIRVAPAQRPPQLQRELDQYRTLVGRLRDLMPRIHATLLAERDRIEQKRGRVGSAAEWARRSRETL
jgi:hypothetical protein